MDEMENIIKYFSETYLISIFFLSMCYASSRPYTIFFQMLKTQIIDYLSSQWKIPS